MNKRNDNTNYMAPSNKTIAFIMANLFFYAGPLLFAQLPDGTRSTVGWIEEIKKNRVEEEKLDFNEASVDQTVSFSVVPYVIRDVNGLKNCREEEISESIYLLNNYFKTIHVEFRLQPVQYINDYNYASVSNDGSIDELIRTNSMERTINLYLVESARDDTIPCYGFTWFPGDSIRNYIFLDKDFIRGNYLVTLMGHFFGLLSTHDTLGGFENASENNCAESGDFICDTWADPNLFMLVDTLCAYTGDLSDRVGQDYVPSVANLMSESCDRCKCLFTPQQYRRMLFCLQRYRYYLR
jgi:hypothetical protein